MNLKRILSLCFVSIFTVVGALAQSAAPRETATASLGGHEVSIEYGRPALKGRGLDALISNLPADRMWRAGSEQVTTLTTAGQISIGDETVPAGKYSLYIHCGEDGEFSLAVNKVLGQPLGDIWAQAPANLAKEPWPHFNYSQEIGDEEVARIPLQKATTSENQDRFKIAFEESAGKVTVKFAWGDHAWSAPVTAGS